MLEIIRNNVLIISLYTLRDEWEGLETHRVPSEGSVYYLQHFLNLLRSSSNNRPATLSAQYDPV